MWRKVYHQLIMSDFHLLYRLCFEIEYPQSTHNVTGYNSICGILWGSFFEEHEGKKTELPEKHVDV